MRVWLDAGKEMDSLVLYEDRFVAGYGRTMRRVKAVVPRASVRFTGIIPPVFDGERGPENGGAFFQR